MTDNLNLIADASKLRILADWCDMRDRQEGIANGEVQHDLRRIADYLTEQGTKADTVPGPAGNRDRNQPTLYVTLVLSISNGLCDLGAELHGCSPSMLAARIIKELCANGFDATPPTDEMVDRVAQVILKADVESSDKWVGIEHYRAVAREVLDAMKETR